MTVKKLAVLLSALLLFTVLAFTSCDSEARSNTSADLLTPYAEYKASDVSLLSPPFTDKIISSDDIENSFTSEENSLVSEDSTVVSEENLLTSGENPLTSEENPLTSGEAQALKDEMLSLIDELKFND